VIEMLRNSWKVPENFGTSEAINPEVYLNLDYSPLQTSKFNLATSLIV
jgi:hypothetical protein